MEGIRKKRIIISINAPKAKPAMFERVALPGDDPRLLRIIEREHAMNYDVMDFNMFTGIIRDIEIVNLLKFGKHTEYLWVDVEIIDDAGELESRTFEIQFDSGFARQFLNTFMNFDHMKPVTFNISGKSKNAYLWFEQDGAIVHTYWNKDNPGGQPDWKKIVTRDRTDWDRTELLAWYENHIKDFRKMLKNIPL